jgi:hypothetical protein
MKYVSEWEQVVGCTIDSIKHNHMLRIYLNDAELILQLETVSESNIDIIDPETYDRLQSSSLHGKKIKRVVVPYFDDDVQGDPAIRLGFDSGPDVLLNPEDMSSLIRIT